MDKVKLPNFCSYSLHLSKNASAPSIPISSNCSIEVSLNSSQFKPDAADQFIVFNAEVKVFGSMPSKISSRPLI
jgi:hypothetical protein